MASSQYDLVRNISDRAHQLRAGETTDYDTLLDAIGDSRFVLIGEASHGTHEFYRERELNERRINVLHGRIGLRTTRCWRVEFTK